MRSIEISTRQREAQRELAQRKRPSLLPLSIVSHVAAGAGLGGQETARPPRPRPRLTVEAGEAYASLAASARASQPPGEGLAMRATLQDHTLSGEDSHRIPFAVGDSLDMRSPRGAKRRPDPLTSRSSLHYQTQHCRDRSMLPPTQEMEEHRLPEIVAKCNSTERARQEAVMNRKNLTFQIAFGGRRKRQHVLSWYGALESG